MPFRAVVFKPLTVLAFVSISLGGLGMALQARADIGSEGCRGVPALVASDETTMESVIESMTATLQARHDAQLVSDSSHQFGFSVRELKPALDVIKDRMTKNLTRFQSVRFQSASKQSRDCMSLQREIHRLLLEYIIAVESEGYPFGMVLQARMYDLDLTELELNRVPENQRQYLTWTALFQAIKDRVPVDHYGTGTEEIR